MPNVLQWQQVDAPRLDTRDLAIAGQTVDNAFNRFADILNARDARLKKGATDNAAAQLMAAQTPEELAALQARAAAGGFGPRADMREILSVGNQRQGDMLQNSARQQQIDIGHEDLLNRQDMAQHAELYTAYDGAMAKGDVKGAEAIAAQIKANGGGRNLYSVGLDGQKAYGDWRDAAERHRSNVANEANAAARLGMERTRFNLELQDRKSLQTGMSLSGQLADRLGAYNTDDAMSLVRDLPEYKALDPIAKRAFDQDFKTQHAAITQITQDVQRATAGSTSEVNRKVADLNSQKLQAQAPILNNPLYRTLNQGSKPDTNITRQSISEKVGSLDGKWTTAGTQAEVDKILNDVRGPDGNPISLEDLNAVIDNYAMKNGGLLGKVSGSDAFWANISKRAKEVADARATGQQQLFEQDLNSLGAPYDSHASSLASQLHEKQQNMRRGLDTSKVDAALAGSLNRTHETKADVQKRQNAVMDQLDASYTDPLKATPAGNTATAPAPAQGGWTPADQKEYQSILDKRMAHIRGGGTAPDITQAEFDRMNALLKKRGSN
ncbi:hypothetical protein [Dyella sp. ASV21]|uniref:hypothetical protein n=1 Tax=Dyella sp. ASV21 TaxID=2795114 RepID=UPI0018EA5AA7|nr:hypothetical protein [Dyella sp. ASV21]